LAIDPAIARVIASENIGRTTWHGGPRAFLSATTVQLLRPEQKPSQRPYIDTSVVELNPEIALV
jgi:hypothetical protein